MATTTGNVCPAPAKPTSNGVFQGDNPLDFALPLAILQICLVVVLTRGIAFLLKPLKQPRVVAEIIGGILLGPSVLGRSKAFLHLVFPAQSLTVLDTLANLGLLFFLFLVGLELDPKLLRRTGKTALAIAIAGITLPFILGIGTSLILRDTVSKGVPGPAFLVFMGVALSITAFPVLARILAELKLLTTDLGRMAMSAAAVNDVAAWILLALAIALSGSKKSPLISLYVLVCAAAFVIICVLVVRPVFSWIAKRSLEGEPVREMYVCGTLVAVLAAAFATDAIGIHALFGAFVLGVLVPKEGPFASALVEKVEDLVSGLLLPLFFVSSGLKTNVATIRGVESWGLLGLVIFTACLGKILGTVLVSVTCRVPVREAVALGVLMNTKGLVELIVLNIGKDRKVLNDQTFAIMVLMALFTTFITTPLITAIYRPERKPDVIYKHRTMKRSENAIPSQLRILACFHASRNIPTLINLIEASRGTNPQSQLVVYAMHLLEMSERSSAILMVHKARKNGLPFWNKTQRSSSDQVVVAFEAFERLSQVSIRPMTAISDLSEIHEDICESAGRKRAAIVILPFHKHQAFDGSLEMTRHEFRNVNKRVLECAPCSVGILVDRGLGGPARVAASDLSFSVTVIFFGGGDDHEALSYGARMAEHPGVKLTVLRFCKAEISSDEGFIADFRRRTEGDEAVQYDERVVRNREEILSAIRAFSRCSLILVGRSPEGTEDFGLLTETPECPELGFVGSLLISPSFPVSASVLVIQQYRERHMSELREITRSSTEESLV